MQQVVQNLRSGRTSVEDVPAPLCPPGGVLVRNLFSVISAGTERTVVEAGGRGLLNTARTRPDLVRRTLDKALREGIPATVNSVLARLDAPVALGYSCAGRVVEVGGEIHDLAPGDLVACAGAQHAHHAEFVAVPRNLCAKVPEGVESLEAAFVTLGAIALQGVRVVEARLGESVGVIGLGLVGQLSVQILRAAGCRVLGIDLNPLRVEQALQRGADAAISRSDPSLHDLCAQFTAGRGLDAVIITADTSSSDPIALAGELARDKAIVGVVGAVGMQVPRSTYYARELELRLSRSYGPGRYDRKYEEQGIDYPVGYVRWTEGRNMEAFLDLLARGAVRPRQLVSHQFPVAQAEQAYDLISGRSQEPYLAVVLEYPDVGPAPARAVHLSGPSDSGSRSPSPAADGLVGIGFVGAGNFASAVLLPAFKQVGSVQLVGVATARGVNAQRVARRFGFGVATTDYRELLSSSEVSAVVVATRHDLHAAVAAEALERGKAVFLEKPMGRNAGEIERILAAQRQSGALLMVGFNRRFAPLARELRAFFGRRSTPLAVHCRVNVGPLGPESWIHDPEQGGGAVLSEACHFVDLIHFLVGRPCCRVFASNLSAALDRPAESVQVQMEFDDGSAASLMYSTGGDRAVPKERIEVIGGGAVGILDDFARLELVRGGRRRVVGSRFARQDKGHRAEVEAFVGALTRAQPLPVSPEESALSSLATLRILNSLASRAPAALDPSEIGL